MRARSRQHGEACVPHLAPAPHPQPVDARRQVAARLTGLNRPDLLDRASRRRRIGRRGIADAVGDMGRPILFSKAILLTAFVLPVEEIFFRFIKNREWDISEMSFGKFIGFASQGNSPFVGIPVFPSRVFRQSAFYVRTDRGIRTPKDLEGKTVGIPEWAQTAGIYARGYLMEQCGVDITKVRWVQAGMNQPGRDEKVDFKLAKNINYEQRRDASVSGLLLSGAGIARHGLACGRQRT